MNMVRIGHDAVTFEARERPLVARDRLGWGILVILHRQRGLALVQILGGMRLVESIREELPVHAGIGLEGHGDFSREGLTACINGLWDLDLYQARGRWYIILPADPEHDVSLTHEKTIARLRPADRTVKIRQHGGIAAIDDIEEQAPIAVFEGEGLEHTEIG
jgi:hypothetical protein